LGGGGNNIKLSLRKTGYWDWLNAVSSKLLLCLINICEFLEQQNIHKILKESPTPQNYFSELPVSAH
jgi:hypothetical protein